MGYLYITEYNNMGDVQWETPMEGGAGQVRTHKSRIGEVSEPIAATSRFVLIFATAPCLVSFVPDGESLKEAVSHAFPVAAETETMRLVHMNTVLRIATYPRDDGNKPQAEMQAELTAAADSARGERQ